MYLYATSHWPSHLRSGACHGLSDELVQELIWLIGDEDALVVSYGYASSPLQYDNKEDIIPFMRSLVEKYRPKESKTLLDLLRNAEANERIASAREYFIENCRRRGIILGAHSKPVEVQPALTSLNLDWSESPAGGDLDWYSES